MTSPRRPRHHGPRAAALAAIVISLVAARAHADSRSEAKAHVDRATTLHADGHFAEALDELKTAYALDPRPDLLYAIAQLHVKLGMCPQAISFYQRFLASNPKPGPAAAARQAIDVCTNNPASLPNTEPKQEPKPAPQPEVQVAPTPPPVAAPVPPPPLRSARSWYTDVLGDVLVGGGLAAGVAGGWMYRSALARIDDANAATTYPRHAELADQAHTQRTYAILFGAAGGTLVVTGLLRFALGDRRPADHGIAIAPTTSGGIATWTGRF
jgi:tetratricopeptide (TPR) repeat protein